IFSSQLDQGASRTTIINELTSSGEYRQHQVEGLFEQLLHRSADPTGMQTYTAFLASGGTVEQVAAMLAGSQEYFQNRAGGSNDGFLSTLFTDVLHRPIDAVGQAALSRALAGRATRQQVADQVFASGEYKGVLVEDYYGRF